MEKVDTHGYLLDMNNAHCRIEYSIQDNNVLVQKVNIIDRAKMLKLMPEEWYVFFIH